MENMSIKGQIKGGYFAAVQSIHQLSMDRKGHSVQAELTLTCIYVAPYTSLSGFPQEPSGLQRSSHCYNVHCYNVQCQIKQSELPQITTS